MEPRELNSRPVIGREFFVLGGRMTEDDHLHSRLGGATASSERNVRGEAVHIKVKKGSENVTTSSGKIRRFTVI